MHGSGEKTDKLVEILHEIDVLAGRYVADSAIRDALAYRVWLLFIERMVNKAEP
jgi:hypothetical protein